MNDITSTEWFRRLPRKRRRHWGRQIWRRKLQHISETAKEAFEQVAPLLVGMLAFTVGRRLIRRMVDEDAS